MRAAGGRAVVVGSRDPDRARAWAADHQVEATADYAGALDRPDVDAVYIALPNDQHVEWAAAAAATGRPVICEKPLGLDATQVDALLAGIPAGAPLWESFAFPFHPQTELLRRLVDDGTLGEVREIVSEFHFDVRTPTNIRLDPALGGGALYDVGCYPVRLARLLFGSEVDTAAARSRSADSGVDIETAAVADFTSGQRLILSAGMRRPASTATRIIGSHAELRVGNPFHPTPTDTVELWRDGALRQTWSADPAPAFQWMIEHAQQVVRGGDARITAAETSGGNARALDLIRAAAAR
ncbi:Gfo/Idh/MocA family protein [Nakamurella deserti]|uniref:Gfo/Idh/MocA family protein n=1 Tax=Nakamurella deserti TaxID=2164074 RepID=UPI001F0BCDA6|nr:Gfo/Idh/MocA family oxidoreductase [Nakamurella deserti]